LFVIGHCRTLFARICYHIKVVHWLHATGVGVGLACLSNIARTISVVFQTVFLVACVIDNGVQTWKRKNNRGAGAEFRAKILK
jgi:hypothetical protein